MWNRNLTRSSAQTDPSACIEKIVSAESGLSSLQAFLRCDVSLGFVNGPATKLLNYVSHPVLKSICGGYYLRQVILQIAEPPIFWNALFQAFQLEKLELVAQERFAWAFAEAHLSRRR